MEEIKDILYRVSKNPETIHIKAKRFLKKKYTQQFIAKRREKTPYTLSLKQLKSKLGVKKLHINETAFFNKVTWKDKDAIKEADKICQGKYHFLGKDFTLNTINWHKDYHSGRVWPKKHYSLLKYDFIEDNSDKKMPWELSKFTHITTLGLAFAMTKKDKYKKEFARQIKDWIKNNPYETGINWVTPMEVAIRAINWIQGYYFFKDHLPKEFWEKYIIQLYLHGKFIEENLEWSPKKENHYLSDIVGLFFLGTFFKHTKKGKKWIEFAKKELEKEIIAQVSVDGVDYEASLNYHRLVTELFLLSEVLARKNNIQFSKTYKKRLENMCNFIMHYTSPSGLAPSIGDTDNGRVLHIWAHKINDHRDLLTAAATHFKRSDFKAQGNFHKSLLLLIKKKEYDAIKAKKPKLESITFTDHYILRDKDLFLLIHCGDIGRLGFGGHGHNDQLSFVLAYKGKDYIVDPGTFAYTGDIKARHIFRATAYHNTPVINNKEQNRIVEKRPFNMDHKTHAKCTKWEVTKDKVHFIGEHKGFSPITLEREIMYDKKKKEITIIDKANKNTDIALNIHLNKEIKIERKKKDIILDDTIKISRENFKIKDYFLSESYGKKEVAKRITTTRKGKEIKTRIVLT